MHQAFLNYIRSYSSISFSENDLKSIKDAFKPIKYRRRQFLHQGGDICKFIAFIVKGATIQYSVNKKGKVSIVDLSLENSWVGDRESFNFQKPSMYYIEAWEQTDALIVTRNDLEKVVSTIPLLQEVRMRVNSETAITLTNRVNNSISLTAEERYKDFLKQHQEFFKRFPQHIIASYLGMTKETLSRIRKNR